MPVKKSKVGKYQQILLSEDLNGWLFSKKQPGKMIVISSQRTTIVDCNNGEIEDCNIDFDEDKLTAYCDKLPDEELCIAGEYGGTLPNLSGKGEKVDITSNNYIMRIYVDLVMTAIILFLQMTEVF